MWPEVKEGLHWVVRHPWLRRDRGVHGHLELLRQHRLRDLVLYVPRSLHLSAVAGRLRLRRRLGRRDRRRARRSTACRRRSASAARSHLDHALLASAMLAFPLAPQSFPLPVLIVGEAFFGFGAHRVQHHAGEPAPGDHARAPAGADERRDALDRLGHDSARHARRRRDRNGVQPAHSALGRRDRPLFTLPADRSSRRSAGSASCRSPSMHEPAAGRAGGGIVEGAGAIPRRRRSIDPLIRATVELRCPSCRRWRRGAAPLDDPVSAFPIAKAGPAHIATLKTFDPPLAALEGRKLRGAERRGKRLLFPTEDGELVLLVHLMTAGPAEVARAGERGPKTPAFALEFAGGSKLVLTENAKKKRAGVWLLTPEQAEAGARASRPRGARPRRRRARRDPARASRGGCTRCSATSA